MNENPSPPGVTEVVLARKVLVLAPHFDDEVLGCGGLVRSLVEQGAEAQVLFLTDGSGGKGGEAVRDPEAYAALRLDEAKAAAAVLGLGLLSPLSFPDGELSRHVEAAALRLGELLSEIGPDLVLVTSPTEVSEDHVAAFSALYLALTRIRPGDKADVRLRDTVFMTYEVNHLQHPDLLVDVSPHIETLERAMACHRSQQERHDYWGAYLGRSKLRALTLGPEVQAVEAFRRLALSDFTHRGYSSLLQALGARSVMDPTSGPLISVIVRTFNRPRLLAEALASVGASNYRRIEVLVVNDGGDTPELPTAYPFEIRLLDLPENRGRAAAAQAGVEAATGEYLAFLDDDDVVEPEHYAVLQTVAGAAGVRVAYTDAAVGVYHLDGEDGWKRTELRLPYSRDFDAERLLVDNYIPFHTLLIERALVSKIGGFDETLGIFEDWDLLIRLAKVTPFHHLRRVTCEYRQFRGAGHHVLGDRPREQREFLATKARVLGKHRDALSDDVTARIVDGLRAEVVASNEELRFERTRGGELEQAFHREHGALVAAREHLARVEALAERDAAELEGLRRRVGELEVDQARRSDELKAAYGEIERLGELIRAMESTRAWKLHQRIQGLKP